MSRLDVLVLGGGPAGATLAALAAAAGARVRVVERERFPREKVCGEFVSAEGSAVLRRLGVLDSLERAGARWMRRARLVDLAGREMRASLPELPGAGCDALGVTRGRLDGTLLELAGRSGAEVVERHEAVAPALEHGRVGGARLRAVGSRRDEVVRASLVVAADGRRSCFVRALHPGLGDPQRSLPRSWFGLAAHFEGLDSRRTDAIELYLFDGGYAGCAPIENDRRNLGLLVRVAALRAVGGAPDRLLAERIRANPAAREALGHARRAGDWRSVGPLSFRTRRAAAAGALFVGDAAGTIDPFCGEGISHALLAAEMALPFVLEAAARGALSAEGAQAYERAWRRRFAGPTRRARCLGQLFERPRLGTLALALLAGPARALAPRIVAATRTGVS